MKHFFKDLVNAVLYLDVKVLDLCDLSSYLDGQM